MRPALPRRTAALLLLLLCTVAACKEPPPGVWGDSREVVVGAPENAPDSMRVDVYVDGTVSMSGFVSGGSSHYVDFLDEVESTAANGWRKVDMRFFKFGSTVRPLGRPDFRTARTPAFYAERGMSAITQIDSTIECPGGAHIGIVLTDLFQSEGDVQAITSRIKNRCFARGLAVGVLAIPSQFDGMVYDARVAPYRYTSTGDRGSLRPFYALMFGAPEHLERLHHALRARPYVQAGHFLLVSPVVVEDYAVTLTKDRNAKHINRRSEERPNRFSFDVRKDGEGGMLLADVAVKLRPSSPDFRTEAVQMVAFRKDPGKSDSTRTEDLALRQVRRRGDTLAAILDLRAPRQPGSYAYRVSLITGALDGFTTPAWVRTLSSAYPSAASDPNKTLNLEKFVMDLRRAASSVHAPELARWYLDVRRL